MEEVEAWRNRPLQSFYPFAFVDCIYVSLLCGVWRQQVASSMSCLPMTSTAARMSLASGSTGRASMLDADLRRAAGSRRWDLGILSMDGVSGLEEGAKAVFRTTVQRCIVHLIRNSIRYIPQAVECIHEAAEAHLWCHQRQAGRQNSRSSRPTGRLIRSAISVWENNFSHVEQL